MKTGVRFTLLLLAVVSALPGYAQDVAVTDESFIRAALMVASFDHFEAGCRRAGGFSDEQAGKVAAWRDKNGVNGIRSRHGARTLVARWQPDLPSGNRR